MYAGAFTIWPRRRRRSQETLQRIAALYEIEARVRGKSAADRLAVRQAESKPLVAELRIWFEAQIEKLPARGPTAKRSAMR